MATFRKAKKEELKQIAHFIGQINHSNLCLHCVANAEDIYKNMYEWLDNPEDFIVVAEEDGQLVGALCNTDYEIPDKEGWLWGPFIKHSNYTKIANGLWDTLHNITPGILKLNIYVRIENKEAIEYYASKGFKTTSLAHLYKIEKSRFQNFQSKHSISILEEQDFNDFKKLHELAFPGAYHTAQQITELSKEKNIIYTIKDGRYLLGYLHAEAQDAPPNGYVHFLAIDPAARRKGLGKNLLGHSLNWFFNDKNLKTVTLTVKDDNPARKLYESVGFVLEYSGNGMTWKATK